jgi:DNA-binding transcriptional regulator YhcF (GntR family)
MSPSTRLDLESPVPLYHQLAEAIRYRIATGALKPGAKLPPLRRAARTWNVNLHTVRRAYAELERLGVVETRVPHGTRVRSGAPPKHERSSHAARARFLSSIVSEARLRHGMSVDELVQELGRARTAPRSAVSVVECSRTQCDDLAGQIEARWRVRADPRPLQDGGAPPPGVIVATYFHYNDVRTLWPERIGDVRFLAIAPEPTLAAELGKDRRGSRRIPVVLCEKDEPMARNIAADLGRILPASEFHLATEVVSSAEECLEGKRPHTAVLLSPRLWGELPERLREDPRCHQVRYVFDGAELDALAMEQGWEAR